MFARLAKKRQRGLDNSDSAPSAFWDFTRTQRPLLLSRRMPGVKRARSFKAVIISATSAFSGYTRTQRPLRLKNGRFSPRLKNWGPSLAMFLLTFSLSSQYNSNFLNYSKTGRSISFNLDYEAGSNGMSGNVGNRLLWGGHISNETKDESARHLKAMNNFGVNVNYDVSTFIKGGKKHDLFFGFKNQEVLNATYSSDFFNLMFRGNGYFKGATADLSNCNINALRFQEFKFGAMLHHVDSLGKIGVAVSLLKGEQLFYIRTRGNSSLSTSAAGDELVFHSNFNMALSDTTNKGPTVFNGIGASADLYFETPYNGKLGKRSVLTVNANNIGFIHWWNNSVQYSSDSTLRFTGLSIRNISDLRDSTLSRINRDTLLRDLANARNENFNVNIPANLILVNKAWFGEQELTALSFGFRYIFNANYKPYIFIEPERRIGRVNAALHCGYGGYTRFNAGASVSYTGPKVFVRLGSNALQGFFMRKAVFAQSVYVSVAYRL